MGHCVDGISAKMSLVWKWATLWLILKPVYTSLVYDKTAAMSVSLHVVTTAVWSPLDISLFHFPMQYFQTWLTAFRSALQKLLIFCVWMMQSINMKAICNVSQDRILYIVMLHGETCNIACNEWYNASTQKWKHIYKMVNVISYNVHMAY